MPTAEEMEWKKANGAHPSRVKPMLAGILAAAILGGSAFGAVYMLGNKAQRDEQALHDSGYEEVCYNGHSYHQGPCNQGATGMLMLAAPAIASLIGFVIGFSLGGGKISSTYFRGVDQLGR